MKSLSDTILGRALGWMADAVFRHRRTVVFSHFVLFAVCVVFTCCNLEFDTNRDNLVGSDKASHKNFLRFKKEFPAQDDLAVIAESDSPEKNRQFIERLGARVEVETRLFKDVMYRNDFKMLGAKALLFVKEKDLGDLAQEIREFMPFIEKFAAVTNLTSLFEMVNSQFAHAKREQNTENEALLKALPMLGHIIGQANASLERPGAPPSPGIASLFNGPPIFSVGDFTNLSGFARRIQQRADPVSAFLSSQLDEKATDLMGPYVSSGAQAMEFQGVLLQNLNRILSGPSVYDSVRFAKVELRFDTANLLKRNPAGQDLIQLNRLLLEDAYPAELARNDYDPDPEHITFSKGRIYLLNAHALAEDLNEFAVKRLRELIAKTQLEVQGVNVGLTGEPVLELDEMAQSQKDATRASIISLIICALIFIYGYNEIRRPLIATLCLLVGLAFTLAFTTLAVGHLNILTITFMPILIGLAIDFGVHLITRYEEELRRGLDEVAAMRKAIQFTGQGVFTGALTTACAFLAMGLTNFKGIQEMGIICGGGMLICLVPMMTMLPAMLFTGKTDHHEKTATRAAEIRARIENIWLSRPVGVVVITVVLVALSLTQFHRVFFDYDLLNMQSAGLPSVIFEKKLVYSGRPLLFGAIVADSAQQAITLEQEVLKLPSVGKVDSMASYLTADPAEKLKLIAGIKKAVAPLQLAPVDSRPVQLEELSRTLYSTYGYFGQVVDAVEKDDPPLAREAARIRTEINNLRKRMLGMDAASASRQLAKFQQALFDDVHGTFDALRQQDDSSGMRAQDLPAALRDRFIGVSGKFLLQVYPKKDVWQRANQEEFVRDLRTVDANVTGTPVQLYEYTTLLKDSYIQAAEYALGAICLMVAFHFRTLSAVVLALLPVAIGSIWMGGIMGVFGIPFNPANIMTLPLVIGIGVTNGIHILNRVAEEKNAGILSKSTGKAVFVSGLTTISGFGSLILAQHQGIRSLGEVMSVGVATCMIAGLTFLPALLNLIAKTKQPSGDNARSTLGREEPR